MSYLQFNLLFEVFTLDKLFHPNFYTLQNVLHIEVQQKSLRVVLSLYESNFIL